MNKFSIKIHRQPSRLIGRLLLGVFSIAFLQARLATAEDNKTLGTILDSPLAQWRVGHASGTTDDYKLTQQGGRTILTAGLNTTLIISLDKIEADSEVTIRFRLANNDGKLTKLSFLPGLKTMQDTAVNPLLVNINAPAGKEQEKVTIQMPPLPGKTSGLSLQYANRALPDNRQKWPDMVRSRMEQDFAATPALGKRWLTLRYVVRPDSTQIYLDGILLRDVKASVVDPRGYIRLSVFEGTQLAGICVHKLPPENPIFETVPLDYAVNASKIAGASIQHTSLPDAGTDTRLANIPFKFARIDEQGHDHVDVGRSWMRFGMLEGQFDPAGGELPRWRGLLGHEAGRLTFQVRNAPYSRIHLLAAFDGDPDEIPMVSVQFYRPNAGQPVHFAGQVPLFTAKASSVKAMPVKQSNGRSGNLYLVTIPLEPEGLARFADLDRLEFELTKEVHVYRAFPDPSYYSQHGAGLPSGVHVYAITLEKPPVTVDFQPDKYAHIWTAPEKPSYTAHLHNQTAMAQSVQLEFSTVSHDGIEKTSQKQRVRVPANGNLAAALPVALKRYGYHRVRLRITDAQGTRTQTRSLAYLHPDTRESKQWEEGKGPLWGFWDWNGSHDTPTGVPRLEVANAIGIRSSFGPIIQGYGRHTPEEIAYARKHGWQTQYLAYQLNPGNQAFLGVEFDAAQPEAMKAAIVAALKKSPMSTPTELNKPEMAVFWAEPMLGPVSYMSLPEYYGDPPYQMTEAELANFKKFNEQFVIAASAIKQEWPGAKCYLPWGIASFPIPFLRNSKAATELMDGPAIDQVLFERLPEMQMHQVSFASTLWQLKQEWIKAGKKWPVNLITIEGGGLASPATAGGLTMDEEANHSVRGELILAAYGVTRHLGWPSLFRCADYWGEQHYGGGLCESLPLLCPKVAYSAYATMTRHLDGMNYVKTIQTASASVFCLQFKHYKTGELLHVLWTLRGKRPVTIAANGSSPMLYDSMDNASILKARDRNVLFTLSDAPVYLRGLKADAKITLGIPDHSDARPATISRKLTSLADSGWSISNECDEDYETAFPEFVKKFPALMSLQRVLAPANAGGKALAVHFTKPARERRTMPFYTTLVPDQPVGIPGKANSLGLWVHANSDWGRFVYCLRDAKGERWISIGKKGEWNVDDPHSWSAFNFDGWRYLRFEMPGNQPWDLYHDAGSSFWGYYGAGDGIVDLPLKLEKVIVERRTHVIKVTDQIVANPSDVLLGDLYAEYARPQDQTAEAVRLSKLRMPVSHKGPELKNPIQELTVTGIGTPPSITRIVPPERESDGTRAYIFFDPVPEAISYDVWLSAQADGQGAVRVGQNWKEPGQLLTGLPAKTTVFFFVTYTDKNGKVSKPSAGKSVLLKDDFPFK